MLLFSPIFVIFIMAYLIIRRAHLTLTSNCAFLMHVFINARSSLLIATMLFLVILSIKYQRPIEKQTRLGRYQTATKTTSTIDDDDDDNHTRESEEI